MKRLFIIYIFINIVKGDIDISKYIGSSDEIPLKVINIPLKGVLNLRAEPSPKGKIIYHIPYNAKNLITYSKDILDRIKNDKWVEVKVIFDDGFYLGWVKGRYIDIRREKKAVANKNLVVIYPSFLLAKVDREDFIHIYSDDMLDCGDREQISLELKVYLSLRDVFINDNFHIAYSDIVRRGWFKNGNSFGERIDLYGMRGYMSKFYLRDCIVTVYFFNIDGKILIIKDISKDRDSSKTKEDILKFIVKNLIVL